MIAASAIPVFTDALVATWTAALGSDLVFDGPGVGDDTPPAYVLVGVDDPDGEVLGIAAESSQTWAWLGHVQRDEIGSVRCAIVSWSGETDMKAARDAAFALLADLASAVEADPSLGTDQPSWFTGVDSLSYRQEQDANGAICVIMFSVGFHARVSAS